MKTFKLNVVVLILIAGSALAQMRGGSGGGMSGGTSAGGMGQGSAGGMNGGSGMGSMGSMGPMNQSGGMMTQSQRRQLMHTTSMQDQKFQTSARAMSNVQGNLSRMQSHGMSPASSNSAQNANASSLSSANAQQGDGSDPSGDLSSALDNLEQSNDDFASSLNSDQQAVVAGKLKDLQKKTKEMQTLAEQVKAEVNNPQADSKAVREHMKKLDKLGKEIAKEQREVASALGISA